MPAALIPSPPKQLSHCDTGHSPKGFCCSKHVLSLGEMGAFIFWGNLRYYLLLLPHGGPGSGAPAERMFLTRPEMHQPHLCSRARIQK